MNDNEFEIEFAVRATLKGTMYKGQGAASVTVTGEPGQIMRSVLTAMYAYPEFKAIILTCAEGYLAGIGKPDNLQADRL
jgi:hypothetical protein